MAAKLRHTLLAASLPLMLLFTYAGPALAHCDTLDGPVVAAARQALDQGNPNLMLIWVSKDNEPEVRAAFDNALAVRKLNPAAREMADHYFFETLVRVHRQGEGAPYTGLKPAAAELGPAIPAADRAIATGDVAALQGLLTETVQAGLREQFARVQARKRYEPNDLAAGRAYVEAYVAYVHYVEGVYEAASASPHGHYEEAASPTQASAGCQLK